MHRIVTRWFPSSLLVVGSVARRPSVRLLSPRRPSCICSFAPTGRRPSASSGRWHAQHYDLQLQPCFDVVGDKKRFFHPGVNFAMRHGDINFATLCRSPTRLASGLVCGLSVRFVCTHGRGLRKQRLSFNIQFPIA